MKNASILNTMMRAMKMSKMYELFVSICMFLTNFKCEVGNFRLISDARLTRRK